MASTPKEVKRSGGSEASEQKSGKDGLSETREEQQQKEEEEGGSVDLKKQKEEDNKEEEGGGSGVKDDEDDDDDSSKSKKKKKKPWYKKSRYEPSDSEDSEDGEDDEEEKEEKRERRYHMKCGVGLAYAFKTDDAPAFIYIMYMVERRPEAEDSYLIKAVARRKFSIAKALMRLKNINLLTNSGSGNALHYACAMGIVPLARLLMRYASGDGVLDEMISDRRYSNGLSLTPIDLAIRNGFSEINQFVKELKSEEANLSEDNTSGSSTKNAEANLSEGKTAGSSTKNAEANLLGDNTAGSSTKNAEANPSKKQKTQV